MTVLRIMQLNIGSLFEPKWGDRSREIVAWIDRIRPDIICMQEVWESDGRQNTAEWIAETCRTDWHVAFGGGHLPAGVVNDESTVFGSAILSRWPIDDHNYHALPTVEDPVNPADFPWELLHARTVDLDIFSTHLAAAPSQGHHRQLQVVEVDKLIKGYRGTLDDLSPRSPRRDSMPAILCGDFNAEPESDEIRFLSGFTKLDGGTTFYQDAWRVAGEHSPGYTQDWRTHMLADRLNVHRKRIDYVFVGDPFLRTGGAGKVLAAGLVCDESLTGIQASDHMGLLVEIEWPTRPEGAVEA